VQTSTCARMARECSSLYLAMYLRPYVRVSGPVSLRLPRALSLCYETGKLADAPATGEHADV
jgi:hypothetical protein